MTDTSFAALPLFHSDLSGVCHWASDAFLRVMGLRLDQLRGQFWLKVVHPEDRTRIMNVWDDAMARRSTCEFSFRVQREKGEGPRVTLHAQPIHTSGHSGEFCVAWIVSSPTIPSNEAVDAAALGELQSEIDRLQLELRTHSEVERALRVEVERLQTQQAEENKKSEQVAAAARAALIESQNEVKRAKDSYDSAITQLQSELSQARSQLDHALSAQVASSKKQLEELEAVREEFARDISALKSANAALQELVNAQSASSSIALDASVELERSRHKEVAALLERDELYKTLVALRAERDGLSAKNSELSQQAHELRGEMQGLYRTQSELGRRLQEHELLVQRAITEERQAVAKESDTLHDELKERISALERELLATRALVKSHDGHPSRSLVPSQVLDGLRSLVEFEASQIGVTVEYRLSSSGSDSVVHPDEIRELVIALFRHVAGAQAVVDTVELEVAIHLQSFECRIGPCVIGAVDLAAFPLAQRITMSGGALDERVVGAHAYIEMSMGINEPLVLEDSSRTAEVPTSTPSRPACGHVSAETPDSGASPIEHPAPDGPRVLVAEDNLINQRIIGKVLHECGCLVDFAVNGKQVFEFVQRNRYDLIFMDCQMPVVDGYEATKGIRASERNSPWVTPIVAMSAHVDIDSEKRCRAAGMESYLTKPVQRERIIAVLQHHAIIDASS